MSQTNQTYLYIFERTLANQLLNRSRYSKVQPTNSIADIQTNICSTWEKFTVSKGIFSRRIRAIMQANKLSTQKFLVASPGSDPGLDAFTLGMILPTGVMGRINIETWTYEEFTAYKKPDPVKTVPNADLKAINVGDVITIDYDYGKTSRYSPCITESTPFKVKRILKTSLVLETNGDPNHPLHPGDEYKVNFRKRKDEYYVKHRKGTTSIPTYEKRLDIAGDLLLKAGQARYLTRTIISQMKTQEEFEATSKTRYNSWTTEYALRYINTFNLVFSDITSRLAP